VATGDSNYLPTNIIAGPGMVIASNGSGSSWVNLDLPSNSAFKELESRVAVIEKRLAILQPNETLQAKYPSLQEAYDHYKLIEKLVEGKTGNDT